MLDRPLRHFFEQTVKKGALQVEFPNGQVCRYGDGTGDLIALRLVDRNAVLAFYINPALRVGEAYMDGRIVVDQGSLFDFIALMKHNGFRKHIPLTGKAMVVLYYLADQVRNLWRVGTERRYVSHHYDLDIRMYQLFLDADLQYTCAYFEREDMSLEEAQLAKKRHVTAKLLAEPGHRILDMGCGWGGLALYISELTGASVTGVTLSSEQVDIAKRRAVNRGLEGRAAFRLQNYRDVEGEFDRIISIGMLEHVGRGNYDVVFKKTAELLTDNGVAVFHAIGRAKPVLTQGPFNDKYIFPGAYVPAISEIYPAIERAGLVVKDLEILPMHYARTCRLWRERFMNNWDAAAALYDERFCRMWELYLAASESAFTHDRMMIFQFQLAKPGAPGQFGVKEIKRRKLLLENLERDKMTVDAVEP